MIPYRASGPQNHPRAKVAVSVLAGAAASSGGAGSGAESSFLTKSMGSLLGSFSNHSMVCGKGKALCGK